MKTSALHVGMKRSRAAARTLALLPATKVNRFLSKLAKNLIKHQAAILKANTNDVVRMKKADPARDCDRLQLTPERIAAIAADLKTVARLPSPLGTVLERTSRPNGLQLEKVSVPFGVIGIIYEARPNVTIDALALCLKAGSAVILKGGSDAKHSNEALVKVVHATLAGCGMDKESVMLLPSVRESAEILLTARGLVDVIIPRGGRKLIDLVRQRAQVPVIETGAGVVHTYVDHSANLPQAAKIILNAKTRRVSVCNTLDTLIIHRSLLPKLPMLVANLEDKHVQLFADKESYAALKGHYDATLLSKATAEHFGTEFLSLKLAVKTVKSADEAIDHINTHGSQHSEAILAEDKATCERFLREVDAATVYANASVSFSDGAQFGMGGEIGISTQKLHARGPMGLREIVSYKWLIRGDGQTRT